MDSTVPPPPSLTPFGSPTKPNRRKVLTVVILILFVVAIAIGITGYFYATHARAYIGLTVSVQTFLSSFTVPSEVRNATFVLSPAIGGGTYTDRGWQFKLHLPGESADSIVFDYARAGKTEAYILGRPGEKDAQIVINGKVVYTWPRALQGIAVSPDGNLVAFAEASSTVPMEKITEDPALWSIIVYNVSRDSIVGRLPGFDPLFVDNDTLIRFTPNRVLIRTLSTNVDTTLEEKSFARVSSIRPTISRDGSLLAWSDATASYTFVYKLGNTTPRLTVLSNFHTPLPGPLAITSNGLYYLDTSSAQQPDVLWRYPLTGGAPEKIRTFPLELKLLKMLP